MGIETLQHSPRLSNRCVAQTLTQKLQTALHAKAKESPNTRFHALYDKVYRKDVLAYAYERCKANGGAAGVDNTGIQQSPTDGPLPKLPGSVGIAAGNGVHRAVSSPV